MPGFEELAPDQKAVLQLMLKQGRTYDDIAGLLRLERANVRERALDALDALGAEHASGLSSERQDELADHLLLQQTASERASTREFLKGSAPGRTWARGVANELRPIGGDALPDIPAEPAEVAEAFGALDERTAARERQQQSSKLGGVLILLAIGAVIGLGILLLIRNTSDDDGETAAQGTQAEVTDGATGASGATGTGAGAAGFPQQQINLNPPEGGDDNALGFALIAEGGLALQAEGLPQSDLYGVYLYNSRTEALPLGFAAYDRQSKRLAGAITTLPEEARGFGSVVITKQPGRSLDTPGPVVLRGAIKRGS